MSAPPLPLLSLSLSVHYWAMARLCRFSSAAHFAFSFARFRKRGMTLRPTPVAASGPSLSLSECHESPVLHLCVTLMIKCFILSDSELTSSYVCHDKNCACEYDVLSCCPRRFPSRTHATRLIEAYACHTLLRGALQTYISFL